MTATDFLSCDDEPIHLIGRVQSHGALIAFGSDWRLSHASENCGEVLGRPAAALIGQPLDALFPARLVHDLRTKFQLSGDSDLALTLRRADVGDRLCDLTVGAAGPFRFIDIEPHVDALDDGELALIMPLLSRIPDTADLALLASAVVSAFRALTGFDRAMVYRFAEDDSGLVYAEETAPGMEPFLGLHYPASDIPTQARALFLRNPLRLIANAGEEGVPILGRAPLDLSLSRLRAVAPVHLTYLRNMGTAASLSVSLVIGGRLWGLVACHHRTPRALPMSLRSAAEMLGRMVSQKLALAISQQELRIIDATERLTKRLLMAEASTGGLPERLDDLMALLPEVLSFDAIALRSGEAIFGRGPGTDDRTALGALVERLAARAGSGLYMTDRLGEELGAGAACGFGGALVLPLAAGDVLVLLRRSAVQSVRWAGAPEKSLGADGRLEPRASFAEWLERHEGRSSPWCGPDLRTAAALRSALTEIGHRAREKAARTLQEAHASQEILISELNHRARNVFALVRGVVSQAQNAQVETKDVLGEVVRRINALARAHDQLTRNESTSLSELLGVEAQVFEADLGARLRLEGPDHWISARAAPVVALVLHELVTNAVKYGALGAAGGTAVLTATAMPDGGLRLDWTESGGPVVRAPERKGFGRAIIERSLPFELGGQAELRFDPGGVRARFVLPAAYVRRRSGQEATPFAATRPPAPAEDPVRALGLVLLVEDNMLIAMDAADTLEAMGVARVVTARSVAEAMEALAAEAQAGRAPDLAILDVNLGKETSVAVAHHLAARGCPFVLASGYSQGGPELAEFPPAPLLAKPFDAAAIRAAVARALGRDDAGPGSRSTAG